MKLSNFDRVVLLQILPGTAPLPQLGILADLHQNLNFTEEEWAKYNIRQVDGAVEWDENAVKEIPIGEIAESIIKKAIKEAESKEMLHYQWLETLKKFGFEPG